MTTPSTHYVSGSTYDYRKDVMYIVRPQVERETCMDMAKEPSNEVVDKEGAHRIGIEKTAADKFTQDSYKSSSR